MKCQAFLTFYASNKTFAVYGLRNLDVFFRVCRLIIVKLLENAHIMFFLGVVT
jgi:hypothetical protein